MEKGKVEEKHQIVALTPYVLRLLLNLININHQSHSYISSLRTIRISLAPSRPLRATQASLSQVKPGLYLSALDALVKNAFRATAPRSLFPKMYIGIAMLAKTKFRIANVW